MRALQISDVEISYSLDMGNDPSLPPSSSTETGCGRVRRPRFCRPEPEYAPPPRRAAKAVDRWAIAPATYVLLGINCRGVSGHAAGQGEPDRARPGTAHADWGANNAGSVLCCGQWWRIVTAMFVHVGIIHLATNMWCLWNLGLLAEPLMGSWAWSRCIS